MLTHDPSLSFVSRYPVASESPRVEARHHQPDLPCAPTPRAFARVSSCSIVNHQHIRYRTYLILLFNTTGEETLVLFVQSHYTWLFSLLTTFFVLREFFFSPVNPISRSCCVLSFVGHVFKMSLGGGKGCTPNSLNVRVQRFMSIWHNKTS